MFGRLQGKISTLVHFRLKVRCFHLTKEIVLNIRIVLKSEVIIRIWELENILILRPRYSKKTALKKEILNIETTCPDLTADRALGSQLFDNFRVQEAILNFSWKNKM